jgi:signal transduction histidine kinase/CheY-like chemotaxis protein
MDQHVAKPGPLTREPFFSLLRRVAEQSTETEIAASIADAADALGVTRLRLSSDEPPVEWGSSELRVRVPKTAFHIVATVPDASEATVVDRLEVLASTVSLAFRLYGRERDAERTRFHATLGRGVAGVVHDIANPLNALQLSLDAARDGIDVVEAIGDARDAARLIHTALDRLRRFIGAPNAHPAAIDVGAAIASALRVASISTRGKAEVVVRVSPGLAVWARPGEIEHVVVNLLLNAAEALSSVSGFQHRITVSAVSRNGEAVIEVQDTGPGVAPDRIERLFDEGFTTKAAHDGAGLGLSICREIVKKLRGVIEVKPAALHGTRVIVKLPLWRSRSGDSRPPRKHDESFEIAAPPPRPRVLVVDGDELVARSLVRAMHDVADVATTTSVDRALEWMGTAAFDLVLCEHRPPHVDGRVLRREQQLRRPNDVSKVVLMIVDSPSDLPRGARVITKPVDVGALKALVSGSTIANDSGR